MSRFHLFCRAIVLALGAVFGVAVNGVTQESAPAAVPPSHRAASAEGASSASKATVVKMTIHAAAAPVPALKYSLLPEVRDLRPGNAALLYQRAHSTDWWVHFIRNGDQEKLANLLEAPLVKLPRDKGLLVPGALREMDLAARREYCDWEMTPRLREEGYALLIPDVQGFRTFGQMLALRARLQTLDGQLDQAVTDMQTGFALSRHVSEAPFLVSALVGMAIADGMLNQVEEFVQREKAPSLYWALADLPRPFIDLRRPMQGEKVGITGFLPEIRAALNNPSQSPVPVHTINAYLEKLRFASGNASSVDIRLFFTMAAARSYPTAKKYLLSKGFSAEQIDGMPVTQVSLMYALAVFDEIYDETYKWQGFPYWQARPGMAKARARFDEMAREQPDAMFLAKTLMPAVNGVVFRRARTDRRIAMLRIVEALRLYAGEQGRLPDHLEDVRGVPVPIDPVTGKAFQYSLEQDRAVLFAPAPEGVAQAEENALRFELSLAAAPGK